MINKINFYSVNAIAITDYNYFLKFITIYVIIITKNHV